MHIAEDAVPDSKLPETFNETQIGLVMRNPVWAFVYWDISESDRTRFVAADGFTALVLRVSFFSDEESVVPEETFDVQIDPNGREQYVLFPAGKKFVRVDLVAVRQAKSDDVLSYTKRYKLPHGSPLLSMGQPGRELGMSEIMRLSSLDTLLEEHYKNHRQSFIS